MIRYARLIIVGGVLFLSGNLLAQDTNFWIFLCFGQSNMEGFPGIEAQDKEGVDPRFQVLAAVDFPNQNRMKGNWYPAVPPLCRPNSGISPADYFGRTLVSNLPPNIRVGVVSVAVAGCKIELFDKENFKSYATSSNTAAWMKRIIETYSGNPYQHLVDTAKLAQKDGVVKGILLHQGESNNKDKEWPGKVKAIYENLLKDLNLKAQETPLLAGELVNADQNGACASMNGIIGELPKSIPTARVVSSAGCEARRDRLHFAPAGYREFGRRYAETMLPLLGLQVKESRSTGTTNQTNVGPRGGGFGGAPMTAEDKAAIAKLAELPPWRPGVGDGDYLIAPPFNPAPENTPRDNVPKGKVSMFHLNLAESKYYPPSPGRGGNSTNREVVVYIPAQYVPGTPAPLLLTHDAMGAHDNKPAPYLPDILDNMIADKRLPVMVAVMVMPSNQRSLEYDTVSGKYAEFIEEEVLPRVSKDYNVTFSKNPGERATMGGSSGGAAALSMAWFHPELYRRVLVYSGTFVNLRNGTEAPHGAWEYHENFIPKTTPNKPLRIWLQVGERDNGANSSDASMRNWVLANMHMAHALKAKGYSYQFVYCKEAGHVDRPVRAMTVAPALEWLWK